MLSILNGIASRTEVEVRRVSRPRFCRFCTRSRLSCLHKHKSELSGSYRSLRPNTHIYSLCFDDRSATLRATESAQDGEQSGKAGNLASAEAQIHRGRRLTDVTLRLELRFTRVLSGGVASRPAVNEGQLSTSASLCAIDMAIVLRMVSRLGRR